MAALTVALIIVDIGQLELAKFETTPTATVVNVCSGYCVYNGVPYRQGQEWTEGCKQKCRCDDASNDVYNCFDRYFIFFIFLFFCV